MENLKFFTNTANHYKKYPKDIVSQYASIVKNEKGKHNDNVKKKSSSSETDKPPIKKIQTNGHFKFF